MHAPCRLEMSAFSEDSRTRKAEGVVIRSPVVVIGKRPAVHDAVDRRDIRCVIQFVK